MNYLDLAFLLTVLTYLVMINTPFCVLIGCLSLVVTFGRYLLHRTKTKLQIHLKKIDKAVRKFSLRAKLMPSKNGVVGKPSADYDEGNKGFPLRDVGYVDFRKFDGPRMHERSKVIKNNLHYQDQESGLWKASHGKAKEITGNPSGWKMPWSPRWAITDAPLQSFFSNTASSAPQGGEMLYRLSHWHDYWVSMVPINPNNGVVPTRNGNIFTWVDLFPGNGTMNISAKKNRASKVISYPAFPSTNPRIGFSLPDACSYELSSDSRYLRFLDPNGHEYMKTSPAYGWWDNGTGGITLVYKGVNKRGPKDFHTFELVPIAEQWAGVTGPVHFDPSVVISGDADIDGFYVKGNAGDWNFGGAIKYSTEQQGYTSGMLQSVIRSNANLYPTGDITSAVYSLYWISGGSTEGDGTQSVHRMVDANAGYIQGSSEFPEVGAPCLNYKAYHATTPTYWASGTIEIDSGTDYDATAGLTWDRLIASDIDQYNPYSLPPEWFEAWRATPANNGGIYMKELVRWECSMVNTNGDPTKEPFLTLTYTEGTAPPSPKAVKRRIFKHS